jgi:regulator of replication initiation timing
MNMLTQRDRLYRTNEDVQRQINQLKQQIEEIEAKLVENGGENATTAAALEVMKNLLQEMQKANANPSIAQQLESTLDK